MKKIDFSKTIGLVRYFDGAYRPSNERQKNKMDCVMGLEYGKRGKRFINAIEIKSETVQSIGRSTVENGIDKD